MKKYFDIKNNNLYYVFTGCIAFIFCICSPICMSPDSEGYLKMDIYRSVGYPLFIAIHKLFFGVYYLKVIVITQTIFSLFSSYILVKSIEKALEIPTWILYITFSLLLLPLIYEIKVANHILSEGIAYPLYLLTISYVIRYLKEKNSSFFIMICILLLLLIQVRAQFLFLIVALLFILLLNFKSNKKSLKYWLIILVLIITPAISIGIDITFHSIKHNKAITTPWTGIQIASMPFFVSNENNYKIFQKNQQQEYFRYIYSKLSKKELLLNKVPNEPLSKIDYYYAHYVDIANKTLSADGELFFKNQLHEEDAIILNDKMASSITLNLIKANFFEWSKLYFQNVTKGLGSAKYLILITMLCFLSLLNYIKKASVLSQFIFFVTLIIIGNSFIVALAEPVVSRYTFYNNWILITVLLILFHYTFNKKNHV